MLKHAKIILRNFYDFIFGYFLGCKYKSGIRPISSSEGAHSNKLVKFLQQVQPLDCGPGGCR